MKPIQAENKVEFCEFCGSALSNQGFIMFACNKTKNNGINVFTSPCTKEDYLKCHLNPQGKVETKHAMAVKNIISNQDGIITKLNQYYLNQVADKINNDILKDTGLHLCWYWHGPDNWETIELGLADKDGDGVDPGVVFIPETDPE